LIIEGTPKRPWLWSSAEDIAEAIERSRFRQSSETIGYWRIRPGPRWPRAGPLQRSLEPTVRPEGCPPGSRNSPRPGFSVLAVSRFLRPPMQNRIPCVQALLRAFIDRGEQIHHQPTMWGIIRQGRIVEVWGMAVELFAAGQGEMEDLPERREDGCKGA